MIKFVSDMNSTKTCRVAGCISIIDLASEIGNAISSPERGLQLHILGRKGTRSAIISARPQPDVVSVIPARRHATFLNSCQYVFHSLGDGSRTTLVVLALVGKDNIGKDNVEMSSPSQSRRAIAVALRTYGRLLDRKNALESFC